MLSFELFNNGVSEGFITIPQRSKSPSDDIQDWIDDLEMKSDINNNYLVIYNGEEFCPSLPF